MTVDPITVRPEDHVTDHIGIFESHRFNHIPVVTGAGDVVGMISRRDFDNYSNITKLLSATGKEIRIRDIMTSPVFSYFEDVDVKQAAIAMIDYNIHAIVVVNKNEDMLGIVTSTDLLRIVAEGC